MSRRSALIHDPMFTCVRKNERCNMALQGAIGLAVHRNCAPAGDGQTRTLSCDSCARPLAPRGGRCRGAVWGLQGMITDARAKQGRGTRQDSGLTSGIQERGNRGSWSRIWSMDGVWGRYGRGSGGGRKNDASMESLPELAVVVEEITLRLISLVHDLFLITLALFLLAIFLLAGALVICVLLLRAFLLLLRARPLVLGGGGEM
eukprot:9455044-Pyramimonas_sp.AAC.1